MSSTAFKVTKNKQKKIKELADKLSLVCSTMNRAQQLCFAFQVKNLTIAVY